MRAAILAILLASSLTAQTPFYLGTWHIESSARAPWATPADRTRALTGNITFSEKRISGPGLLACRELKYDLATVPPDGLFQGMLGEGNTAATAATKLGFGPRIESLYTGCEHSIDFHFFNHETGAFALDNLIYRIRKINPGTRP